MCHEIYYTDEYSTPSSPSDATPRNEMVEDAVGNSQASNTEGVDPVELKQKLLSG